MPRFQQLLEARSTASPSPTSRASVASGRWTWRSRRHADPAPRDELLVELALSRLPPEHPCWSPTSARAGRDCAGQLPGSVHGQDVTANRRQRRRTGRGQAQASQPTAWPDVEFRHGSWFAPLAGERFDLIASNPPYIAEGDPHLQRGDLRFEPASALSSGSDGLDAIRDIVDQAGAHLLSGGWLLLEHGLEQGVPIRELLETAGFSDVDTVQDLELRDRVTCGRWG